MEQKTATMTPEEILAGFKNLTLNEGEVYVELKRVLPPDSKDLVKYVAPVDVFDFTSPRIYANILCKRGIDGKLTSVRTGKEVKRLSRYDQVCYVGTEETSVGAAFDYDDVKILYTRRWVPGKKEAEYFFAVRECRDCEVIHHRVWGEEIDSVPKPPKM